MGQSIHFLNPWNTTFGQICVNNGGHFEIQDGRHLPPLGYLHQSCSCTMGPIEGI